MSLWPWLLRACVFLINRNPPPWTKKNKLFYQWLIPLPPSFLTILTPIKKKITIFSNFQIQSLNTEHPHNSLTQWLHCTNGHRARAPANQHQMPNQFASNLRTPYLLVCGWKWNRLYKLVERLAQEILYYNWYLLLMFVFHHNWLCNRCFYWASCDRPFLKEFTKWDRNRKESV